MQYHLGFVAVYSFLVALATFLAYEFILISYDGHNLYLIWIHIINYKILCILSKLTLSPPSHEVSVRAFFLGYTFGSGILIYVLMAESWRTFGIYAAVLSTFHLTEYLAIAFTNPAVLSVDSFVLNHSTAYTLAAVSSWVEFLIERFFFPQMKESLVVPLIGIAFCVLGDLLRKAAILTAKRNFNHIVQDEKASDHELVTHGVYSICRHPSYVGWFYWSVGTQLILQNPVCLILYTIVSWKFFHERIFIEEISLLRFFGTSYMKYQDRVGTGLPFISGCRNFRVD
ncbi:hypothetical protein QAD02_015391 [Eretmocerus hayati]|uniref:Uncharacterized protein n=1 Tax=Eretmocerus hayati TaxID=131215 RepID=A0ACC2P8K2_9HYME|nr:hypothetical protein QAD02_015391 [Eretmocerus hayati]